MSQRPAIRRRQTPAVAWDWRSEGDSIVIIVGVSVALGYTVKASTNDSDKPDRTDLAIEIAGSFERHDVTATVRCWQDSTTLGWRFAGARSRITDHNGHKIAGRAVRSIRPLVSDLNFWARRATRPAPNAVPTLTKEGTRPHGPNTAGPGQFSYVKVRILVPCQSFQQWHLDGPRWVDHEVGEIGRVEGPMWDGRQVVYDVHIQGGASRVSLMAATNLEVLP